MSDLDQLRQMLNRAGISYEQTHQPERMISVFGGPIFRFFRDGTLYRIDSGSGESHE